MLKYKSSSWRRHLVGTLSMYKDVKIGELAGWRYWCSPRLMSRGVQPPINRNVYATFYKLYYSTAVIDLSRYSPNLLCCTLLWHLCQLAGSLAAALHSDVFLWPSFESKRYLETRKWWWPLTTGQDTCTCTAPCSCRWSRPWCCWLMLDCLGSKLVTSDTASTLAWKRQIRSIQVYMWFIILGVIDYILMTKSLE